MYQHDKIYDQTLLLQQVDLFITDAHLAVSLLANLSALLKLYYPEANWVGFYLVRGANLYLGPFQGNSACQVIPFGKGVCGTAASTKTSQLVNDVLELENHIACDASSRSELVVPIIVNDEIYGVLDIDAPTVAYFSAGDQELLEKLVSIIEPVLPTLAY